MPARSSSAVRVQATRLAALTASGWCGGPHDAAAPDAAALWLVLRERMAP